MCLCCKCIAVLVQTYRLRPAVPLSLSTPSSSSSSLSSSSSTDSDFSVSAEQQQPRKKKFLCARNEMDRKESIPPESRETSPSILTRLPPPLLTMSKTCLPSSESRDAHVTGEDDATPMETDDRVMAPSPDRELRSDDEWEQEVTFPDEKREQNGRHQFGKSYSADPGGSIFLDSENHFIASNISVKTDSGECYVEQVDATEDGIAWEQYDTTLEEGLAGGSSDDALLVKGSSSLAQVHSDMQEWVVNKSGRHSTPTKAKKAAPVVLVVPPPTRLKSTLSTDSQQPVLGKVCQLVVPKLPLAAISKLKSSGSSARSTPLPELEENTSDSPQQTGKKSPKVYEEEGEVVVGEYDEDSFDVGGADVGGAGVKLQSESAGGDRQRRVRNRLQNGLKSRRLKKRDFIKSEGDPSEPPSPQDYSYPLSNSSSIRIRSNSSSNDDITFSDVASNVMGDSPRGRPSKERSSSRDPSRRVARASHTPTTPTHNKSLWDSDDDFETTSIRSSQLRPSNTPTPRKKKKKILHKFSSDEEKPCPKSLKTTKGHSVGVAGCVGGHDWQVVEHEADVGNESDLFDMDGRGGDGITAAATEGEAAATDGEAAATEEGATTEEGTATEGEGAVSSKSLSVNIPLVAPIKLGKHTQGPHSKGKEKAPGPPALVQCSACGKDINWRTQKVHAHPRLNVLTCQVSSFLTHVCMGSIRKTCLQ